MLGCRGDLRKTQWCRFSYHCFRYCWVDNLLQEDLSVCTDGDRNLSSIKCNWMRTLFVADRGLDIEVLQWLTVNKWLGAKWQQSSLKDDTNVTLTGVLFICIAVGLWNRFLILYIYEKEICRSYWINELECCLSWIVTFLSFQNWTFTLLVSVYVV